MKLHNIETKRHFGFFSAIKIEISFRMEKKTAGLIEAMPFKKVRCRKELATCLRRICVHYSVSILA